MNLGKIIKSIDKSSDQWDYEERLMSIKKHIVELGVADVDYINLFPDRELIFVLEVVFKDNKTVDDDYLNYLWNELNFKNEDIELSTLKDSNYLYIYPKNL